MSNEHALPELFEDLIAQHYNADDVARIVDGCVAQRAVTLRANTLLSTRDEIAASLNEAGISYREVPWYDDAFIVDEARENALWPLPAYQQGKMYLQNLSAMIPALVVEPQAGEDICDMCAAPGGKTSQLAALSQAKSFITACELHAPRAEKLEHNLRKLGVGNVTILRTDARRLDEFFSFDRILIDAPCSGSGTLRAGDAKSGRRFTRALLDKSIKSQCALLSKALSLLKPGGTLVYATCSVLPDENERIVEWGLQRAKGKRFELKPVDKERFVGVPTLPTSIEEALCVCPTKEHEGFFVAKIVRK